MAHSADIDVVTSLAGRVRDPRWPRGEVRVGGFGGADGLRQWLPENGIDAVLDATHPFAARISANAFDAARRAAIPYAMYRRPPWVEEPGDRWIRVQNLEQAADLLPQYGTRAFLTIGRQGVSAFGGVPGVRLLIRAIDPPPDPLPAGCELLLARGPFAVDDEIALMRDRRIEVLVTKDSGGDQTYAKIEAARRLALPVLVLARPPVPAGAPVVNAVDDAVHWLERIRG
ncbi:precorrin-6A/cobalt-precorrin-6A reductase [Rhodococcus sp. 27YEA15]